MGIKYLNLSSLIQVSTIKDEKSAAKFHYIKLSAAKLQRNKLPFEWYQYIGRGTTAAPEILAQTDLPSAEGSEF